MKSFSDLFHSLFHVYFTDEKTAITTVHLPHGNCTVNDFDRENPTVAAVTCTEMSIHIPDITPVDGER